MLFNQSGALILALVASALSLSACGAEDARNSGQAPGQAVAPTPTSTAAASGQWQLVWSDEFTGNAIDRAKWDFDIDCWGGGNQERQCYTDRQANAAVSDGMLSITAREEEFTGPALPLHLQSSASDPNATNTKPFTSARLVTRGLASWRYGKIEVRAKLPQGQGTWPAIWMLPEDNAYGGWALSGEIDIMEAVNLGVDCAACPTGREDTILGTLHFGGAWPDNDFAGTEINYPSVLEGFHTYGIIWSEGEFVWTVDGEEFARRDAQEWFTAGSDSPNAPFDEAFHLIINLAIGGGLPEERGLGGVSNANFPKTLEVDWVRVWQCDADFASGKGCENEGVQ